MLPLTGDRILGIILPVVKNRSIRKVDLNMKNGNSNNHLSFREVVELVVVDFGKVVAQTIIMIIKIGKQPPIAHRVQSHLIQYCKDYVIYMTY